MPRVPFREESHHVADWMIRFIADGAGPAGGWKLIDEDEPILLNSPASALREIRLPDGSAGFYKTLATDVQAEVGEGASMAVFLAAHLVRSNAKGHIDGIPLAKRQLLAWLEAQARPHDWPDLPQLHELERQGTIALDDVDIRVDRAGWHNGLALKPQFGSKVNGTGNVLLLQNWKRDLQNSVVAKENFAASERESHKARIAAVHDLGVGLVVCAGALDDSVGIDLQNLGIYVHHSASLALLRRLERATLATTMPTLAQATGDALGTADWHWDDELIIEGPGPAATFGVEAENNWAGAMAKDLAERKLRLAGALLGDNRALPNDWLEGSARMLRGIADHAPGRAPLGIVAVADALEAFSRAILEKLPGPRTEWDSLVAIRLALTAGLDTALQITRIDARHEKRQSSGAALQGGGSKIGSPKGLPGDVPPLM